MAKDTLDQITGTVSSLTSLLTLGLVAYVGFWIYQNFLGGGKDTTSANCQEKCHRLARIPILYQACEAGCAVTEPQPGEPAPTPPGTPTDNWQACALIGKVYSPDESKCIEIPWNTPGLLTPDMTCEMRCHAIWDQIPGLTEICKLGCQASPGPAPPSDNEAACALIGAHYNPAHNICDCDDQHPYQCASGVCKSTWQECS